MKIIIADDHDLVRDALTTLIERDDASFEVLPAGDFHRALELLTLHSDVDLVLLDVYMPGMNDLQSVDTVRKQFENVKIVLMSGHVKQTDISKGFDLGVHGFISKTMNGSALISVLKLVQSGVRYVPELVLSDTSNEEPSSEGISRREKDVLVELCKGLSNKVIARNLSIEETTVKLHLRSIFKKLNAANRTEAVVISRKKGLID